MAEEKKDAAKKTGTKIIRVLMSVEVERHDGKAMISCYEVEAQTFRVKIEGAFDGFSRTEKHTLQLGGTVKTQLNMGDLAAEIEQLKPSGG